MRRLGWGRVRRSHFHICNHKLSFISVCVFFFHTTGLEGGKKTQQTHHRSRTEASHDSKPYNDKAGQRVRSCRLHAEIAKFRARR